MIVFKYIRWKNFLSTGNAWTEVKLNKSKSTLIVGENGAGKSTILDALSFTLYGKPFRKINKPQLMNSINGKGLECEVEFDINSRKYKITRGVKPNKFEIYENGKFINQNASARDYQEYLERHVLKLNHKSFSQIVVLGNATFTPFMQLPAMHRREVIEDLLDIQIFTTMNTLLKDKVTSNKEEVQQITYQVDMTEEKIKMQQAHIASLQKDTIKRIDALRDKIDSANSEIGTNQQEIDALNEKVQHCQAQIADKETVSKKKKKIEQLEYKLEEKIRGLEKEINFYEHYDNCPTCKQEIDEVFKKETVDEKSGSLNETTDGFSKLKEEYKKITTRLEEIQTVQEDINDLLLEVNNKNSHINALNRLIQSIQNDIDTMNADNSSTEEEQSALNTLQTAMKDLSSKKEELVNHKSVLDIAQMILRDNGIKTKIIRQYVPIMNKLINKYLAAMDFFVQFELDENFDETIRSRFRDEFSYASFSEGEKMRIDLALLFTWRAIAKLRNSVSTNLLIMDEVFDSSLDTSGTDEFMKILNELTSDVNVFIISHKGDQLYDKFHSVIKFEKHKNFSRIAA